MPSTIKMNDFSGDMGRLGQAGQMKEQIYDIMCLMRVSGLDEHAAPTDALRVFVDEVAVCFIGHLKGDRTALGSSLLRSREYDGMKHIKRYQRAACRTGYLGKRVQFYICLRKEFPAIRTRELFSLKDRSGFIFRGHPLHESVGPIRHEIV